MSYFEISHGCYAGNSWGFHAWRSAIAEVAGASPPAPITKLLNWDCSVIPHAECLPLAEALEALPAEAFDAWAYARVVDFAAGLRAAHKAGEAVEFR